MSISNKIGGGKKLILLSSLFIFFLIISFFYYRNFLRFRFVDEEENMVIGNYLLKDEILYKDLFSQHQPLTYIFSSWIQKIIRPNSIYLLVRAHRVFIILWSFVWSFVLLLSFNSFPILIFLFFYELSKIFLFGNLFLAESLSIYPLIYLVMLIFIKKDKKGAKITNVESLLVGISTSFVLFFLLPLWPLLSFLMVLLILRKKLLKKNLMYLILGFLPILLIVITKIDLKGYLLDTFYVNWKYYLSSSTSGFEPNVFKPFLTPLLSFFPSLESTQILIIERALSLVIIFTFLHHLYRKKYFYPLISFIILGLANIRFVPPGFQFYRGFHRIVWFSLLIFFAVFGLFRILALAKNSFLRGGVFLLITVLFVLVFSVSSKELFRFRDMKTEYYVNYSRQFDSGEAIRIIKGDKDTLFVAPDDILVYWQAGINHAIDYIFYYPWMDIIPYFSSRIDKLFAENAPNFFYCNCGGMSISKYTKEYNQMIKFGGETNLYVLPEKLDNLTKEQAKKLKFYGFEIN